jgi:PAS domain S-box-containing protein
MPGSQDATAKFEQLRRQAEELIRQRPDFGSGTPADILELIQELRIHQAEVEIQNEELEGAQQELSELYREYEDLYEFAPFGYVRLNAAGIVTRINLAGAGLLGTPRKLFQRSGFSRFVATGGHGDYWAVLQESRKTGEKQSIELPLKRENGSDLWVRADIMPDLDQAGAVIGWRMVLVDITERKRSEQTLRRAVETSEALNRIYAALHSTLDFDEVMRRIVAEGSALLGSESAAVSLREGDSWIIVHVHGMSSGLVGTRMEDDQERHAVLALDSRRPVAVDDAFNDDRFNKEHLRRHNIRSVLVAPLLVHDEALGVVFFNYHRARHEFTAGEVNFAMQMASIAGMALANARLLEAHGAAEDEVRRINRELEELVKERTFEIEEQYRELEELNAVIRQLSRKTIEGMENDRKALSKEIHDSIGGTLAAIKMQLEARLDPVTQASPSDLMPIEKIVAYLTEAIKETRRISSHLRSPTLDDFGLEAALVEHLQQFKQFYPEIEVVSQIEIAGTDIPAEIQTVLYRVVQEALNNAGRHSAATAVHVKLTNHQSRVWLEVADNGCGFDPQNVLSGEQSLMSYGIHSMRERVEICKGRFQIRSEPGMGTVIDITIPI